MTSPSERHGDSMTAIAQRERPHIGIFWLVQTPEAEPRLLTAGCPLNQAEPYGNCLTYGPGHYETWAHWRRDRTVDPTLRAVVRSYEYEDWPRGRIVFDRPRDLFIIYADHKLLTPARIARITTRFYLPQERTDLQSDFHYQSKETPNVLAGFEEVLCPAIIEVLDDPLTPAKFRNAVLAAQALKLVKVSIPFGLFRLLVDDPEWSVPAAPRNRQ